jgi:hypothetical protein
VLAHPRGGARDDRRLPLGRTALAVARRDIWRGRVVREGVASRR